LIGLQSPAFASAVATPTQPPATYQPLPVLPVNRCNDSTLPKDGGTNAPLPSDPSGYGFANESVIGWEGNYYAPLDYLSGAYYARGVPTHYTVGSTTYCGAMYSFGVYNYGLASGAAPAPGSVTWTQGKGYLPAMTTAFTRSGIKITITDFADKQTIAKSPVELVYTKITIQNTRKVAVSVPPEASGSNLVTLKSAPDAVPAGVTVSDVYVSAVDTFSTTQALPTERQLSKVSNYNTAYTHMANYWNGRLKTAPVLKLPNVKLPNTGLANPGTAIDNAYKSAFIYTREVEVGKAQFSGANNYDSLLNHDVPSIIDNRFAVGDFQDAQNLLLTARVSEDPSFNEQGANWYWDGPWKTPATWADYLEATNDVAFVSKYFHDDADGPSQWGPSLYTLMHTDYLKELSATTGYLKSSNDNDSQGTWLFDDESALAGLTAYQYIATKIGNTTEADWAAGAYTSLLAATNAGLTTTEKASSTDYLPCEVNVPSTADRCNTKNDANWAGSNLWSQNVWDIFLQGGTLNGPLGDPTQTDNLYTMGFSRLVGSGVPFPSFGAYPGYSVALNTGYASAGLYGNQYRDLPLTSYAWQIQNTTGGPNAWWEANSSAPDPTNPWAGSHAAPQFGAVPYAWPMASQTQTVQQALVAQGQVVTKNAKGTKYHTALYVGRGVPDTWIAAGQKISISNLTSSYNVTTNARKTYGVKISTQAGNGGRLVTVALSGTTPSNDIRVQLPSFASAGVQKVTGGTWDASTGTVTVTPGHTSVRVQLGESVRPTVSVDVTSTVSGAHTQPTLLAGQPTTLTATITNPGSATTTVTPKLNLPSGWVSKTSTTGAKVAIAAGKTVTDTWTVTPPASLIGSAQLRVDVTFLGSDNAGGTVSGASSVTVQKPLPVLDGTTNVASTATPSASYTSSWENVTAINDGIYPPQSNDSQNLRWGDWPETGTQWIELDWSAPITASGSAVYFLDDKGGVPLPASWKVQYWNGTAFVDVANQSTAPVVDNTFNQVTFDPVSTTKLRVSIQSGTGSVGVLEWVVDSPTAGATPPASKSDATAKPPTSAPTVTPVPTPSSTAVSGK
jgi:hypothetical protein